MSEQKSRKFSQRLAVPLDHGGDAPLYRQIVDHLWLGVIEGDLEPGNRLPTVRQLAIDLGVNPKTVERAYSELELLGVITTRQREGTFVCLQQPDSDELERRSQLDNVCREAVSRAAGLGFSIEELIDALGAIKPEGLTGPDKGD